MTFGLPSLFWLSPVYSLCTGKKKKIKVTYTTFINDFQSWQIVPSITGWSLSQNISCPAHSSHHVGNFSMWLFLAYFSYFASLTIHRQTFWQPASHPDGKLLGLEDLDTRMSFSFYLFSYSSLVIQFLPRLLLGWWRQGKGLPLNKFLLLPVEISMKCSRTLLCCSRSWSLSLLPLKNSAKWRSVAPKGMLRSFGLKKITFLYISSHQ